MAVMRGLGIALIAAGVTIGTVADDVALRRIPEAAGYFVLAGDFHVHSFLGDGLLAPWEYSHEAARQNLDVIAVTNHNQILASRVTAAASRRSGGPIVIVGQEVTASKFHMVAAGISQRVDWRQPAGDVIRDVHAQGGVAIAAHPFSNTWRTQDEEALRTLDGSEASHPMGLPYAAQGDELVAFYRSAARRNPSLAPIGSSDFHLGATLGLCRTFVFAHEVSEAGVLDAIRNARTVAFDGHRRYTGDPALVEAVRAAFGENPSPRSATFYSRLAVWLALAGLLIALLFE
jgi:predicted metal-dependent phosphoesterase TrpH